jgi:hypothetical protein
VIIGAPLPPLPVPSVRGTKRGCHCVALLTSWARTGGGNGVELHDGSFGRERCHVFAPHVSHFHWRTIFATCASLGESSKPDCAIWAGDCCRTRVASGGKTAWDVPRTAEWHQSFYLGHRRNSLRGEAISNKGHEDTCGARKKLEVPLVNCTFQGNNFPSFVAFFALALPRRLVEGHPAKQSLSEN